jgi:general secretion pathway protein A
VVITGEVGSGKTTLINYLLRQIPNEVKVGIINNTFIQPEDLLKMMCQEYEILLDSADKTVLLTRLYGYLLERYAKKERVILIIDEAQNLPEKTLEEMRMLSNLESEKHHLIQMILVGQPQLKDKLKKKSLEQFVQRVTVHCHLDALNRVEVNNYIYHRLQVAGAESLDIFDEDAIKAVYKHSMGIPRLINILCDAALVYGYADDTKVIGKETVEAVAEARKIEKSLTSQEALFDNSGTMEALPAATPAATDAIALLDRKIQDIELRMGEMGDTLLRLKLGMERLNGGKDEKDKIIVSLFKMLKKSMGSRSKLMKQINELKEQHPPRRDTVGKKNLSFNDTVIGLGSTKEKR